MRDTITITADETFGYHAAPITDIPRDVIYRIGEDGTKFVIPQVDQDATACTNIHQGGIVEDQSGQWWALLMMDFHAIGRTVTLAPITWKDGWPMLGLEGNLGRAPRTWLKPKTTGTGTSTVNGQWAMGNGHAPYDRSDDFNYSLPSGRVRVGLKPIWQWNHNPDDSKWSLKKGRLRLQSMPAEQLMWARNTLTQRVIGPTSVATVELYVKGMKDGDVAGLGNINVPCSWIGIVKDGKQTILRCFEQATNDTIDVPVALPQGKLWLRAIGEYDDNQMQYAYSTDGTTFTTLVRTAAMPSSTTSPSRSLRLIAAGTFLTANSSALSIWLPANLLLL